MSSIQSVHYLWRLNRYGEDRGSYRSNRMYLQFRHDEKQIRTLLEPYQQIGFLSDAGSLLGQETAFFTLRYLLAPKVFINDNSQAEVIALLCFREDVIPKLLANKVADDILFLKQYDSCFIALIKNT